VEVASARDGELRIVCPVTAMRIASSPAARATT
jgi:hypothetical protein